MGENGPKVHVFQGGFQGGIQGGFQGRALSSWAEDYPDNLATEMARSLVA